MKYMLMMHTPRGTGVYEHETAAWSAEAWEAHMDYLRRLNAGLTAAGELVDILALTPPGRATLVRAGHDGTPRTDGPFPEAKEFLAGFWIVDVEAPERAYEIAATASAAPGPGGTPLNMPIEVRQVMSGPPPEA
jgi:hypothetical protein